MKKKKKKKKKAEFKRSDTVPLIIFGDGMKHKHTVKIKGQVGWVTGILTKELKKREKYLKNVLVDVNEFCTSLVLLI